MAAITATATFNQGSGSGQTEAPPTVGQREPLGPKAESSVEVYFFSPITTHGGFQMASKSRLREEVYRLAPDQRDDIDRAEAACHAEEGISPAQAQESAYQGRSPEQVYEGR